MSPTFTLDFYLQALFKPQHSTGEGRQTQSSGNQRLDWEVGFGDQGDGEKGAVQRSSSTSPGVFSQCKAAHVVSETPHPRDKLPGGWELSGRCWPSDSQRWGGVVPGAQSAETPSAGAHETKRTHTLASSQQTRKVSLHGIKLILQQIHCLLELNS